MDAATAITDDLEGQWPSLDSRDNGTVRVEHPVAALGGLDLEALLHGRNRSVCHTILPSTFIGLW
ncbi:hypothetical protein, partial [Mesorhizobium sp.]|uniref:hypothetical protein n=1 Tax=Mesorhizobium sp. TaxID=1871066 RepID=UPI0025BE1C6C